MSLFVVNCSYCMEDRSIENDFTKRLSCQKEEFADVTDAIMCTENTQ